MDSRLKQRLVGAAVLVALAVIFLPMLVKGPAPDSGVSDLPLEVPAQPGGEMVTRDLPLVTPAADSGRGAVVIEGDGSADGQLPTVDTAQLDHPDAAELADPDDAATAARAQGSAAASAPVAEPDRAEERAPEPAPAQQPLPPSAASGDYAVRQGSYGSSASADAAVNRLGEAGMPARSIPALVSGKRVWRVYIGPYATRAQAEAVRVRAAADGAGDARVVALDGGFPAPAGEPAPAPSAPEPAARPPAAPDVGFVVQVGAFRGPADADALQKRLQTLGFTAFTDRVDTDSGVLTRVKAGPVADRAAADQLKARIRERTGIDGMVRSHP